MTPRRIQFSLRTMLLLFGAAASILGVLVLNWKEVFFAFTPWRPGQIASVETYSDATGIYVTVRCSGNLLATLSLPREVETTGAKASVTTDARNLAAPVGWSKNRRVVLKIVRNNNLITIEDPRENRTLATAKFDGKILNVSPIIEHRRTFIGQNTSTRIEVASVEFQNLEPDARAQRFSIMVQFENRLLDSAGDNLQGPATSSQPE